MTAAQVHLQPHIRPKTRTKRSSNTGSELTQKPFIKHTLSYLQKNQIGIGVPVTFPDYPQDQELPKPSHAVPEQSTSTKTSKQATDDALSTCRTSSKHQLPPGPAARDPRQQQCPLAGPSCATPGCAPWRSPPTGLPSGASALAETSAALTSSAPGNTPDHPASCTHAHPQGSRIHKAVNAIIASCTDTEQVHAAG